MKNSDVLLAEAIAAHQAGRLTQAEKHYRDVLSIHSDHFDALYMLGMLKAQQGMLPDADRLLEKAVARNPAQAALHLNRGAILEQLKRPEEAIASYDRAIALQPGYFQAHFNRGNALDSLGRSREALESYDRALAGNLAFAELHYNRGAVLQKLDRPEEALASYDKALAINPNSAEAHTNRGNVLSHLTRFREALASYDKALALAPGYAPIHLSRGNALHRLKRFDDAIAAYDRALRIDPRYAEAVRNRGAAQHEMRQYDEALAQHEKALALEPQSAETLSNRGSTLHQLGRLDEAADSYGKALQIDPKSTDALIGLGSVLKSLNRIAEAREKYDAALALSPNDKRYLVERGSFLHNVARFEEARADYQRVLDMAPDDAETHFKLGMLQLLHGDFEHGLKEFEWRWKVDKLSYFRNAGAIPAWTGREDIAGKTILLYADQGLGDAIHFCRYARFLTGAGARVILQVHKPLVQLLSGMAGIDEVLAIGGTPPAADYQCALGSLPLVLGTTISTIPHAVPYITAPNDRVEYWKGRLGASGKPRIGLNWAGNPNYATDADRSILLPRLLPLLDASRFEYFGLQNGLRDGDAEILSEHPEIKFIGDEIGPFEDTAAVISLMDVVVSSDTAIVHLAGALGRPVWILLPFVPDWRWLLDREDCPWYPTARLFRQPDFGDWNFVTRQVSEALSREFGA